LVNGGELRDKHLNALLIRVYAKGVVHHPASYNLTAQERSKAGETRRLESPLQRARARESISKRVFLAGDPRERQRYLVLVGPRPNALDKLTKGWLRATTFDEVANSRVAVHLDLNTLTSQGGGKLFEAKSEAGELTLS
jgi:hypothetical protein